VPCSLPYEPVPGEGASPADPTGLAWFRAEFYNCPTARADALFELADALLCTDRPVKNLVELAPEHGAATAHCTTG